MIDRIRLLVASGSLVFLGCGADIGRTGDGGGPGGNADLVAPGIFGDPDGGGGMVDPGGGDMVMNCGVQNFMLAKGPSPDLIIIQDRSGSMAQNATGGNGGTSKWTSVTTGLEQVVNSLTSIDWGLLMFSNNSSCGVGAKPDVTPGPNTGASITKVLNGAKPGGETPTTAAINSAVAYYATLNDARPHYLLLATDGLPNCGTGGDDSTNAENAVSAAAKAGIHTFVVGIGNDPQGDMTLTQMAKNGLEPDTTPGQSAYYQVSVAQDLVNVLSKVAGKIVSCSFPLQVVPSSPDLVTIQGNGMTIPHDKTHMNGWDYGPGDMSIIFYGMTCSDLQTGSLSNVMAVYGCPPIM